MPFIENAFKHSLYNETGKAWITIDIKVTDSTLFFKTENSFKKINEKKIEEGIGLRNVKKRLQLTYPKKHELFIKESDEFFCVDLKLKLSE
ncbi:MAG: hypothetical protein ACR2FN_10485 [Chitinophagaceae bacterium]